MPDIVVTETISVTEHDLTDEERELGKKYNRLVDKCIDWAMFNMRWGMPTTQLAITRSVISAASRLATIDSKTHQQEQRIAFQQLLGEMVSANAVDALPESTDDQD